MQLSDLLPVVQYQVCGGAEYLWQCYGPNARYMTFALNGEDDICSCVYDTKTQRIYEVEVSVTPSDYDEYCVRDEYKWVDQQYWSAYVAESKQRGHDPFVAYDEVDYEFALHEETILKIVSAVYSGVSEVKMQPSHCPECNTHLENAPGIGLYCPNQTCDVTDCSFDDPNSVWTVENDGPCGECDGLDCICGGRDLLNDDATYYEVTANVKVKLITLANTLESSVAALTEFIEESLVDNSVLPHDADTMTYEITKVRSGKLK